MDNKTAIALTALALVIAFAVGWAIGYTNGLGTHSLVYVANNIVSNIILTPNSMVTP